MNDKNKNGFGIFGAIAVGVAAIATAVVVVNKKKKSKKNNFFKDELIKLPIFKKEEPPKKAEHVDEEDIFEDEDVSPVEEKKSFFSDAEEVSYEEDEEFQSESHAKPIASSVKPAVKEEEPVAVEEPVAEEEPVAVEESAAEDDAFVFESVVVGKSEDTEKSEDIPTEDMVEPVVAEPERITPVMEKEEPVRNSYNNGPVIDELIRAAMEEVTGKTYESESQPVGEPVVDVTTENESVEEESEPEEPLKEEPVGEMVEDSVEEPADSGSDEEFEEDDDIRAHESYYDWIYNVDEHYSVITDGTWVYCKSDDILTSTSVNKKGGRETIDIAETFKNRIDVDGYCLLKYIGTESDVVIPSTINGKPVVAAMNTFRSNQIIKKVTIPSTMLGLRRTFYSCYHLDKIIFEDGTRLVYELDSIMCGNNDMDSNTESTTVVCSPEVAEYFKGHYKLGCPVIFQIK